MAETCVSVYFEDSEEIWNYCWTDGTPYAGWAPEDVTTGLRTSYGTAPRAWRSCQYYLKGMPAICKWWSDESCTFNSENKSEDPLVPDPGQPSGYNFGNCDYLGRRNWCDKYEATGTYDPDTWMCVAPNPFITGLGKKDLDPDGAIFVPVPRNEILGYNDDGTGMGKCDCHGYGRGSAGCAFAVPDNSSAELIGNLEESLNKLPIVCNYYRPYQMGYGVIEPAGKEPGDVLADGTITEQGTERAIAWEKNIKHRLPLNYEVYNHRANFQKCQWWEEDKGREYISDAATGRITLEDINTACTNTNEDVVPFHTYATLSGSQSILSAVWSVAGGPVCNGCRPDCPKYSGKWNFLQNNKMFPGMPVTANQLLELRFWSIEWDSKKQYIEFYEHKPNFDDVSTHKLYTFTKWDKLDVTDASKSIMEGKELDICLPAPLDNKDFTRDFIFESEITYAGMGVVQGTNTTTQRNFPSLIRVPKFLDLVTFSVFYPYFNDNSFGATMCTDESANNNLDPPGHHKRHYTVYGDKVLSFGQTVPGKYLYIINSNVVEIDSILKGAGVYTIEDFFEKQRSYKVIVELIGEASEYYPDYITRNQTHRTYGTFITDPVRLEYNESNKLIILLDIGDGTWEWRWRTVISDWCAGLVKQSSYDHSYYGSTTNKQPYNISPDGSLDMKVMPLGKSSYGDLKSSYSFNKVQSGITYYGWSIKWVEERERVQTRWASIGNSPYIACEIEDLQLNYIFEWEIESAQLRKKQDLDPKVLAGKDYPEVVDLESILENSDRVHPSLCILQPIKDIRYRFFNSIYDLFIDYKYKKFINDDPGFFADVVAGAGSAENNVYRDSPYSVSDSAVNEISKGPINLIGFFYDADQRLIACNSTRAVVNIVRESCRNIEIKYSYFAEAEQTVLTPDHGFCINLAGTETTGKMVRITEAPECADHDYNAWKWEGPLWYPFINCRGFNLYDEWLICNHCQTGYVGPFNDGVRAPQSYAGGTALRRDDFRYCGPHKMKPHAIVRSAKPTPCNCGCVFYYTDATAASVNFSGYSSIREPINEAIYKEEGWRLPPFGNEGRELIERYISDYFAEYQSTESSPTIYSSWLPKMMDHAAFYFPDFNVFDSEDSEDEYFVGKSPSLEPFGYTSQLSYGLLSEISESISMVPDPDNPATDSNESERYKWDSLFEVHHESNCTYPLPKYPVGETTKVVFYYFKNKEHVWAWQEYWKDIERAAIPISEIENIAFDNVFGTHFRFLDLEKPKYRWSYYKEEHQFILDEGQYDLIYTAPAIDSETKQLKTNPSISIGNNKRFFKILYPEDTYNDWTQVDWSTEGAGGAVDGAAEGDNIYETTKGSEWIHDKDTMFDDEAAKKIENAEKILINVDGLTGDEEYAYYNRGLISKMYRGKLDYLPKTQTLLNYSPFGLVNGNFIGFGGTDEGIPVWNSKQYVGDEPIPGDMIWDTPQVLLISQVTPYFINEVAGIGGFSIEGNFGFVLGKEAGTVNNLLQPSLQVEFRYANGNTGPPRGFSSMPSNVYKPEDILISYIQSSELKKYTLEAKFKLGPLEFLGDNRINGFKLTLNGAAGQFISINSITMFVSKLIVSSEDFVPPPIFETINVWERKYLVSKASGLVNNLDGPGDYLQYDLHKKNSGVYFPWTGTKFQTETFKSGDSQSKMRSVTCGPYYGFKEPVEITYSTLHDVEEVVQKDLYEWAPKKDSLGDNVVYTGFIPPKLLGMVEKASGKLYNIPDLPMVSEKLVWGSHTVAQSLTQYNYWRPGGHKYKWSEGYQSVRCMLFGGVEKAFSGQLVHIDHGDVTEASSILYSYYNLRYQAIDAKIRRSEILQGGDPVEDTITANRFNLGFK